MNNNDLSAWKIFDSQQHCILLTLFVPPSSTTMATRSRKKLILPPGMASLAAEPEKMELRTANKSQHPGVIDDWEHPNDMETIGEKLKKKAQKKEDQAKVQKERDKEKVAVADIEDRLQREDVQQNLVANHPGAGKSKSSKNGSSARQLG